MFGLYYFLNYFLVKLFDKVKRSKVLFVFYFFWVYLYFIKLCRNYLSISYNILIFLSVKKFFLLVFLVFLDFSYYVGSI